MKLPYLFLFIETCMVRIIFTLNTCPQGCNSTTCSPHFVCNICLIGYVSIQQKCLPCPQFCNHCNQQKQCSNDTSCITGTTFQERKCLKCQYKCNNDCQNIPTNCNSCVIPFIINSSRCELSVNCPIINCEQCQILNQNTTQQFKACKKCLQGFLSFDKTCHPCPFPCTTCQHSYNDNQISETFNYQLTKKYSSAPLLVFSNLKQWEKQNLYHLYLLYQMLNNTGGSSPSVQEKLDTLNVITAEGVKAIRLKKTDKDYFLNTTDPTHSLQPFENIQDHILKMTWERLSCTGACRPMYFLNGNQCNKCSNRCIACNNATICTACQQGFALINGQCYRCKQPCLTCSSSVTTCTSCAKPYILISPGYCKICSIDNCGNCTNVGLCISCLSPYSYIPSNVQCYRCEQDMCYHCNFTNKSQCFECNPGSALNSQKKCVSCPEMCLSCSVNLTNSIISCWKCREGYALQNGICNPCGFGCIKCSEFDDNICHTCFLGTFLNSNSVCEKCQQGCNQCSSPYGICLRFLPGLTLYNNKTVRCGPGCRVCSFRNPSSCQQCLNGFYLDTNQCKKCGLYCVDCSSDINCTECSPNTHLESGLCKLCSSNCSTCQSGDLNRCNTCRKGYYYDNLFKKCSKSCGYGCADCKIVNVSLLCTKCNSGYALKADGSCIKCIAGCTGSCDPKDVTKCLTCNSRSQMNKNFKCDRCPTGCAGCKRSHCTSCYEGYTLALESGRLICKQRCNLPCLTCNSQGCLTCQAGYKLEGIHCIYNQTLCNPYCQYCQPGTFSAGTLCYACKVGCSKCTMPTDCIVCFDGYYLNSTDNSCIKCPLKCKTCIDNEKCILCGEGYFKQIVQIDNSNPTYLPNCLPCNTKCKTCSFSADQCDSCGSQLTIRDSQCFGRNKVKFRFRFDKKFSQFIESSQSQVMRQRVSNILGIDKSNVIVTELLEGSTVLGGQLSADSSPQAISLAEQLYAAVTANSNVLGYSILGKSIGAFYDDTQVSDPSVSKLSGSTGIIIGCSIAVGVIILITVIVCICMRKKKKSEQQNEKYKVEQEISRKRHINQYENYEYYPADSKTSLDEKSYHGIQYYKA